MVKAQELLNEIEKGLKEIKNHIQTKPKELNIEVLKEMTTTQIKKAQEFFKIQELQENTDRNITKILKEQKKADNTQNKMSGNKKIGHGQSVKTLSHSIRLIMKRDVIDLTRKDKRLRHSNNLISFYSLLINTNIYILVHL